MPLFLSLFFFLNVAFAQDFQLIKHEVSFKIPYTFGMHKGEVKELEGSFNLKSTGRLSTPIKSLRTDKATMDCHLQESLGLDYSKSDFPDSHVCDDDKLPADGGNSIVFPQIDFQIQEINVIEKTNDTIVIKIKGAWNIHGKSKNEQYQLTLQKQNNEWVSELNLKLRLSDFAVIVKKFMFIKVEDTVTLKLKLFWDQK